MNPTIYKATSFTGGEPLNIYGKNFDGSGPLVTISQHVGSMALQYFMTPAQARQMAADLLKAADEAEGLQSGA